MSHLTPPVQPCGLGLTGLHRLHTLLPETQAGAVTAPTINIPFQKQSRDRLHFHTNSSPLTLTPTLEIKQLPVKPSRKLKIRKKSLSSIFDLSSLIKQKKNQTVQTRLKYLVVFLFLSPKHTAANRTTARVHSLPWLSWAELKPAA